MLFVYLPKIKCNFFGEENNVTIIIMIQNNHTYVILYKKSFKSCTTTTSRSPKMHFFYPILIRKLLKELFTCIVNNYFLQCNFDPENFSFQKWPFKYVIEYLKHFSLFSPNFFSVFDDFSKCRVPNMPQNSEKSSNIANS